MAEGAELGHQQLWAIGLAGATFLVVFVGIYFAAHFMGNDPVPYLDDKEPFKHGSTGRKRESGIPYWIRKVLPKMFPEHLPGKTYAPRSEYFLLGFLYDLDHPLVTLPIKLGSLRQTKSFAP